MVAQEEPVNPDSIENQPAPDLSVIPMVGLLLALSGVLSLTSLLFVDLSFYSKYGGLGVALAFWSIGALVIVIPVGIGLWAMRAPDGSLVKAWTGAAASFLPLTFGVYLTGGMSALIVQPEERTPEIFILLFTAGWAVAMVSAAIYVLAHLRDYRIPTDCQAGFRWWLMSLLPLLGWVGWQAFLVIRVSGELIPIWWWVLAGLGLPSCIACLVLVGLNGSLFTRFWGQALVCLLWLPVMAIWLGLPTVGIEWTAVLLHSDPSP